MARILVVDDDPHMRQVLATCLSGFGHSVTIAIDGEAGLATADGGTDLVLSDIEMPFMNGIGMCECLKRDPLRAHLPVLLMTGRFSPDVQRRAERAGASIVLSKPFTWDALQFQLGRFLPGHG